MTQDDHVVAEPTEPQEPVEPQEPTEPAQPQEPQEDYRGKLNATNNFLKKEGYTFDEDAKQWKKPPAASPANPPAPSEQDAKRLDRIELNSVGVKDREEQDFVLSAAKRLGVSPSEAASDEIVAARLEKMRETKRTKEATPSPNRGGASQRSSKLPDFSKMSDAEFEKWERDNR